MIEGKMESVDLYEGLHNYDLGNEMHQLQVENKKLERTILSLENDVQKLCDTILVMKKQQTILSTNISELYKTAKAEIERKDRTISDLRSQLDDLVFRRTDVDKRKRNRERSPPEGNINYSKRNRYDDNRRNNRNDNRNQNYNRRPYKSRSRSRDRNFRHSDQNRGVDKREGRPVDERRSRNVDAKKSSRCGSEHSDRSSAAYDESHFDKTSKRDNHSTTQMDTYEKRFNDMKNTYLNSESETSKHSEKGAESKEEGEICDSDVSRKDENIYVHERKVENKANKVGIGIDEYRQKNKQNEDIGKDNTVIRQENSNVGKQPSSRKEEMERYEKTKNSYKSKEDGTTKTVDTATKKEAKPTEEKLLQDNIEKYLKDTLIKQEMKTTKLSEEKDDSKPSGAKSNNVAKSKDIEVKEKLLVRGKMADSKHKEIGKKLGKEKESKDVTSHKANHETVGKVQETTEKVREIAENVTDDKSGRTTKKETQKTKKDKHDSLSKTAKNLNIKESTEKETFVSRQTSHNSNSASTDTQSDKVKNENSKNVEHMRQAAEEINKVSKTKVETSGKKSKKETNADKNSKEEKQNKFESEKVSCETLADINERSNINIAENMTETKTDQPEKHKVDQSIGLTHEGEIPVLHLDESNLSSVPTERINDKSIMNLVDGMNASMPSPAKIVEKEDSSDKKNQITSPMILSDDKENCNSAVENDLNVSNTLSEDLNITASPEKSANASLSANASGISNTSVQSCSGNISINRGSSIRRRRRYTAMRIKE